eukprot:1187809-Pleurochrysis_carterae.AAC.1
MKRTVSALRPKAALVIDPFCTVCEAAKKCSKAHVDAVLICDDGKLMGILTDTDVLARVIAKGLDPKEVKVRLPSAHEPASFDVMLASPSRFIPSLRESRPVQQVGSLG